MKVQENYRKTILDNGIRVVTERIPHVRSVSIGIWIQAGTCDEAPEYNGVAHFVEHMVFKGTETRSSLEIADAIESLGGSINAFTSKELTCFYAQVLDENIEVALEILSDLVLHPRLDENDIEREKGVVLEEIMELEDTPSELVHEIFIQDLFKPHPLSFSILGTKETVQRLGREDILRFMSENYSANRVVVAAAGNLDHNHVVRLAEKFLGRLSSASSRNLPELPPERPATNVVKNRFQQAHICIGRRAFHYTHPRRYPLLLLNTILGYGMSSRLFQNIREKHGLAYSIYSFADFLKDTGIFGVYLGTDPENIDLSVELVKKELKDLKENHLDNGELEKRKNQLKGNLILGLESTSGRMNRLAKMEIYRGDFLSIEIIIQSINAVTEEDIHSVAEELFDDHQLYLTILKPEENGQGLSG